MVLKLLRYNINAIFIISQIILYNVTFKALRKDKNWPLVESLWEEMLESVTKPDDITFMAIISCARQCNLHDKAIEWYEKMSAFGCTPSKFTVSSMIISYWHAGQSDKAMEQYNQARKLKGCLFEGIFGSMISIYAGSGNFDGALNLYEEMKALGVRSNLVTYNTLLNAMHKAERPWQVKIIYAEMCNSGVVPNRYTYIVLIRSYSKGRYSNDALAVYQKMKEADFELDVILYNMLLSMCADVGLVNETREIFDEMKKLPEGCRPDDLSYSSIITAYSCKGQVSDAEQMFSEMVDVGIKPTIFVLTSLIQCYGTAQQTYSIMRVIGLLPEFQVTPDDRFCGCLLNVATKTPSEDFGKIIDCIDNVAPNVGSFVKLLIDKSPSIQIIRERATELLDSLCEEVKKPYVNCLIDICIRFELTDKARELFNLSVESKIYFNLQEKHDKQWILQVNGLSYGAALNC
jgi:pentatricopeptide repeat protein